MRTKNGSLLRLTYLILAVGVLLGGPLALLAADQAQTPPAKPANCNAYKLDEKSNQIVFNDPRIIVKMPEKQERERLRSQGTPGQLFLMKNCDTPDLDADVQIFSEVSENPGRPAELVPSAVRVVIVGEQGNWIQVKGHTSLWKGTGWVKVHDKLLVVKY